ncbi:molybdenum cofactor guanylyltransferase [Microbacterium murale]|uniref:Molybdopterin-guanine dinucleotide biosynthesis protein A n=1 Tax=Microbacterium murale TaxID=1081040 RepID=A0ABU0P745_9MICO|nr:NTP transferase domain-containing protein [Microbacterium murale]MDQ0642762.1 molybdopterin-guanine dinucleotide biosynthesis protein A [Microbacterium murale]
MNEPAAAALVLAGGRSARLNRVEKASVEKASVEIDGIPLIDHVYAAVRGCAPIIAVGPGHIGRPGVRVVREQPPFGGPAAATAAAIVALEGSGAMEAWLLACDLPRARELVERLSEVPIPDDADAVVSADAEGRVQWLAGRYRVSALQRAVAQHPHATGSSMREFLAGVRLHTVDDGGTALDLDTWAAIEEYRSTRKDNHV